MSKENQARSFWQNRGLYIALLIAAIVVITVAIVLAATATGGNETLEATSVSKSTSVKPQSNSASASKSASASASKSASVKPSSEPMSQSANDSSGGGTQTAATEVYFIMPVENGVCVKDFTEASVVYNKTLGIYTGHMGMDITGEDGARVLCVYDGEITSIVTSYLQGTTITVTHANGLKSIYNSVEVDEDISVGDRVRQGDVLGTISDNNRQEYKDGAHLHFEVEENGVKVSPTKYFMGYDK